MAKEERKQRHQAIRDIVRGEAVLNQRMLVDRLRERGFSCTQATVSRDITEMGLRKQRSGSYVLPEDLHLQSMVNTLVTSIARSDNLVVVKASAGSGQTVGAAIDAAGLPGALGSVAGDDTVLVIGTSSEGAEEFEMALRRLHE